MEDNIYVGNGPYNVGSRYASRHCYFDIDKQHADKYNETYKKYKSTVIVFITTGIVVAGLGGWLFTFTSLWMKIIAGILILLGIVIIAFGVLLAIKTGNSITMLQRGVLNPAIIAKIDGDNIGLLVLAELTTGSKIEWGIHSMQVKKLPGHEIKIGEKVPVTCSFLGDTIEGEDIFTSLIVTAIAWGTPDISVIRKSINSIPDIEWNALEQLIDRHDYKSDYSDQQCLQKLNETEIKALHLD